MKIKLLLILVVISLTIFGQISCTSNATQNPDVPIKTDTYVFTILPYKAYPSVFENCQQAFLTESDYPIVENLLMKCIEEYNSKQEKINSDSKQKDPSFNSDKKNYTIDLKAYKRQYIVVTNEKGEKEVWVNCFCGELTQNWRKELILVEDGGNCFFNLKLNLTSNEYYLMMVNGEA